ncbi:unnamed protein product [Prorocentrum cordatum]|uniref:RanBP2-type domain-containing protein n=1 Tax=Prorocentrum cordatum TaxID=2364126 RepID=A0ABN9X342_9DINO|nr:unnamed protein product [Polarella glacialis]CAK0893105.1 unnamed protein product [Polarella glacialis]
MLKLLVPGAVFIQVAEWKCLNEQCQYINFGFWRSCGMCQSTPPEETMIMQKRQLEELPRVGQLNEEEEPLDKVRGLPSLVQELALDSDELVAGPQVGDLERQDTVAGLPDVDVADYIRDPLHYTFAAWRKALAYQQIKFEYCDSASRLDPFDNDIEGDACDHNAHAKGSTAKEMVEYWVAVHNRYEQLEDDFGETAQEAALQLKDREHLDTASVTHCGGSMMAVMPSPELPPVPALDKVEHSIGEHSDLKENGKTEEKTCTDEFRQTVASIFASFSNSLAFDRARALQNLKELLGEPEG